MCSPKVGAEDEAVEARSFPIEDLFYRYGVDLAFFGRTALTIEHSFRRERRRMNLSTSFTQL
jgi:hypothetical protein